MQAILSQLLLLLNDPATAAAIAAVASFALAALARRGNNLPIISALLNYLIGHPPGGGPAPATPGTPTAHPVLDAVLALLTKRLNGATPVGFSVVEIPGSPPNTVAVTLHTAGLPAA